MRELPGGQQGDQWYDHKKGRISASGMNDLANYTKGGAESAKRETYRYRLCAERTTRILQNNKPPTPAMQWGIDQEQFALQMFEKSCDLFVIPVGFVLHPTMDFAGASPDGLIEDATLEVKCPESTTYIKWKLSKGVPEEHVKQMQWQMACTGRQKGIFIGYDPRQPEGNRIFFRDLPRDNEMIAKLEAEAIKMNAEVEAMIRDMGLPPTQWLIEDGELTLPSKYAPKSKLNQDMEASLRATEVIDDDWEQIIERRVQRVEEGVA